MDLIIALAFVIEQGDIAVAECDGHVPLGCQPILAPEPAIEWGCVYGGGYDGRGGRHGALDPESPMFPVGCLEALDGGGTFEVLSVLARAVKRYVPMIAKRPKTEREGAAEMVPEMTPPKVGASR